MLSRPWGCGGGIGCRSIPELQARPLDGDGVRRKRRRKSRTGPSHGADHRGTPASHGILRESPPGAGLAPPRVDAPAHTRVPGCAHTWSGTRVFTRVRGGDCHQVSLSARPPPPTASPSSSSSSPAIFVLPAAPAVGIKGFSSNLDVSFQKPVHTFPWHLERGKKKRTEKDETTQNPLGGVGGPGWGMEEALGLGFGGEGWGSETPGVIRPLASRIFHPLASRCRIFEGTGVFWGSGTGTDGVRPLGQEMAGGWHSPCAMGPPGLVPSRWQLD